MNYVKGQILTYHFPQRKLSRFSKLSKSNVIEKYHRVVVLHSRGTPYNTVLVAPVTKATGKVSNNSLPSNYVEMGKIHYAEVLEFNSYINLDMCMPVDENELKKYKKYNKSVDCHLKDFDMEQLDYKLVLTYELSKYIKTNLESELNKEFEMVVELIDNDIKNRIISILEKIEDIEIKKEVLDVINYLLSEIRTTYLKV